ncbi:autotransporter outer membrane beta-barrel domain-containing protein [Martelella lutilitoris]|uniref:Autotransporter outer membrane beta-barrel domain-containing protein n=1 Tax=Martelella lutilitoris TaxID=2583532 RepID=A0A5C4JMI2_9HYPH|nr:autotransporter outer membrane beta-barrel domain-containing protein [Martelella lutilitoris]TNB46686.1 autotransporter outer membrane beta-barrel domain-containing protein [Martelella lutilitoris]
MMKPDQRGRAGAHQFDKTERKSARKRWIASSLLFHSTALAGTLAGVPVPFYSRGYTRVYAQAVCNPSSTGNYINDSDSISATTFSCTISSSSTVTAPQYAYGGAMTWYQSSNVYYGYYDMPPVNPQQGLNITITNSATIDVSAEALVSSMISFNAPGGTHFYTKRHSDGIGVVSAGSNAFRGEVKDADKYSGGAGGNVAVYNNATIQNAARHGIYAVSGGGTAYATYGGNAGTVTVGTTADISAQGFGIVAISRGGATWALTGGAGNTAAITVSGDVNTIASTNAGGGILAASYGGNSPNNISWNQMEGGTGGDAGNATVTLGSSDSAFSGTVSTVAAGSIGKHWTFTDRNSGAAVSAISYGGQGPVNTNGSGSGYDGGNGGKASVTVYGASGTTIKTSGDDSGGIVAASYGGSSLNYYDASKKGGAAGAVYVELTGGGSIATAGSHASGIQATSLGGLGQVASTASSTQNGKGGTGGSVYVKSDFEITTQGDHSHGIAAISSGAGGGVYVWDGNGGFQWGDANIASNTSGEVTVKNDGEIEVYGVDSHGIVAMSIGGGGGLLTSSGKIATQSYSYYSAVTNSASQRVGGASSGAYAAGVTVTNKAAVTTHGGYAAGKTGTQSSGDVPLGGGIAILAQSVGGGGGDNTGSGAIGGIGGSGKSGGDGSDGGTVSVQNYGALTTYGADAHGIVAQSIGGGGGTGRNKSGLFVAVGGDGGNGGDGNEVTITSGADITVSGDYAAGIVAQSIGGGGGAGGKATAWGVGFSDAIGGNGGYGGYGGTVNLSTQAGSTVKTSGVNGLGILAQSIGGGGGSGGAAKSVSLGKTFDIAIATGGYGSGGGDGGTAEINHYGAVSTAGYDATGIVVQSIGGGGGSGGASSANALAFGLPFDEKGDSFALSVSVSHGGDGGVAGDGGSATAVLKDKSAVTTAGDGSLGLHVQSIGGGGGQGGDSTAAAGTATLQSAFAKLTDGEAELQKKLEGESVTASLTFSLGGNGGAAGSGGKAFAHNYGTITTSGDFADGMLVQSIGGGGGQGGTGETDGIDYFGSSTFNLSLSIGGNAGSGSDGGSAYGGVAAGGAVRTYGANSAGLFVQSIGGGGGKGGGGTGDVDADNKLEVGIGATGGEGGDGGTVYAWNNGTVLTKGDSSPGLVAQSIGGGGGQGGSGTSSIGHAFEFEKETKVKFSEWVKAHPSFDVGVTLSANTGASGGDGGYGGNVYVGVDKKGTSQTKGTTTTYGSFSHGILAQSIGGGGGAVSTSSSANSVTVSGPEADLDLSTISFGATNGAAGDGGQVTVYAANIYTQGFAANGVIAQSLGGGGGHAIQTGYAMDKVSIKFGAQGQSDGTRNAGNVLVDTIAGTKITTSGDNANGILGQSIGGGGGFAGVALGTYNAVNDESISGVISSTFGGGSDSGDTHGEDVTINHYGSITTSGKRSIGIAGQSISGGGGFLTAAASNFDQSGFVQKQASSSAHNVDIDVEENASIVTSGDGAFGILAQTVSGGGGVSADLAQKLNAFYRAYGGTFTNSQYYYDNSSGIADQTGYVSVTVDGSVSTSGEYAHGVVAQAIGGSGGIFLQNGKTYAGTLANFNNQQGSNISGNTQNGNLEVTINGSVKVSDPTAWGGWAQATGPAMSLTIGSGGVLSGSTAAADNGEYSGGAIYSSAASRTAITHDNHGTVTGNIVHHTFATASSAADGAVRTAARAGTSLFINQGTGTLVTGHIADAGSILNAGSINPGGTWSTVRTRVTGDLLGVGTKDAGSAYDVADLGLSTTFSPFSYFDRSKRVDWRTENSSKGGLLTGLDVDMENGTADTLLIEGDFAGTWGVDVNANALLPNTRAEFLKAEGMDMAELSALSSLVFDFTDVTKSAEGWQGFSVADAHFADNGVSLGRNAGGVSRAMQQAWDRIADGSATEVKFAEDEISLGAAFGAFHQADPDTFDDMLLELASQTAAAPLADSPSAAIAAANSVLSCPAFATTGVMMDEGSCVWSRALGGETTQGQHGDSSGYTQSVGGLQFGGQAALADGWFLGSGLTYENSWFRNKSGSEKMEQQSFTGAVALKKEAGPWLFGFVGGAGYNWGDSKRYINLDTLSATARGEPDSAMLFARARASYEFAFGDEYYMRPKVDFDVINMHQFSYTESGAGAMNLMVDGNSDTAFGVTPGIEFGARIPFMEDWPARLYGDLGVSFLTADSWETTSRFAGLSSMDSFSTFTPIADTVGHVTLGLDLAKRQGMELKFQYDGAFADDYQSHTGSIRFGYRF